MEFKRSCYVSARIHNKQCRQTVIGWGAQLQPRCDMTAHGGGSDLHPRRRRNSALAAAIVALPGFGAAHRDLQPRGVAHHLHSMSLTDPAQPPSSEHPEDNRKDHERRADKTEHPNGEGVLRVPALELLKGERSLAVIAVCTSPCTLYRIAGSEASAYEAEEEEEKACTDKALLHAPHSAHLLGISCGGFACLQAS
jgi:hypothetical protein